MARLTQKASSSPPTTETGITVPLYYQARSYQEPCWQAFRDGVRRHVCIWHRRAGKDTTYLNITISAMLKRIGNYRHVFPTLKNGREILWDGIDSQEHRYIEAFPPQLIYEKNESELSITLIDPKRPKKPGSQWQIVGTDRNLDALVGGNPIGIVWSEYALQNPKAWTLAQPILRENGGWAAFCFTPRGKNHGYDLYQIAQNNPEWFCSHLTIDQTALDAPGEAGHAVVRRVDIEADIAAGLIDADLAAQEYDCSFDAAMQGAYYAEQFRRVDAEKRVGVVPWESSLPVHTAWDLGVGDSTAIWFLQAVRNELRLIDYYEASGHGVEHYAKVLNEKPYVYGTHYAPHDITVREFGSGRARIDVARDLGIVFRVVGRWAIDDGIQAVRTLFPRLWFDAVKCADGLNVLRSYQKLYDDKRQMYLDEPYHNWASHGADALRYFAVGWHDEDPDEQGVRLSAHGAPFAERLVQTYAQASPVRAQGAGRRW